MSYAGTLRRPTVAMVGTYPPTQCGIATFSAALANAMVKAEPGCDVDMIELVESRGPLSGRVIHQVVNGNAASMDVARLRLDEHDCVIVQHEFGIYGGTDGDEVLALLDEVRRPIITVLHTVLERPSPYQRDVIDDLCARSAAVIAMTQAACDRLLRCFDVDHRRVLLIPHGAHENPSLPTDRRPGHQPRILTWGLLGPGKGIEAGIDALALLQDLIPPPHYVVAGETHPKVKRSSGERYRESLIDRAAAKGVGHLVDFDNSYRDVSSLNRLIHSADVVLLPYESRDQATSGVLVDAIASGKAVVATDFPHARELLSGGAGIVVAHDAPEQLAAALGRILRDHSVASAMEAAARRLAAPMMWSAVGQRYLDLVVELCSPSMTGAGRMIFDQRSG
jgi:glycosyltransferase involved in cell wall biosynthesis